MSVALKFNMTSKKFILPVIAWIASCGGIDYKDPAWIEVDPKLSSNQTVVLDKVYMYDGGATNGALGGREGADQKCKDAVPDQFKNATVRAFLSIDPNDDIDSFPVKHKFNPILPVVSAYNPNNIIANNWDQISNPPWNMGLQAAGVLSAYYWTGSDENGRSVAGYNCDGFSVSQENAGVILGHTGLAGISSGLSTSYAGYCDNETIHILCIVF